VEDLSEGVQHVILPASRTFGIVEAVVFGGMVHGHVDSGSTGPGEIGSVVGIGRSVGSVDVVVN